jgi:hypothetical protein
MNHDTRTMNTHQIIMAVIYTAALFALTWFAYSGGPSDAEMRQRASTPITSTP